MSKEVSKLCMLKVRRSMSEFSTASSVDFESVNISVFVGSCWPFVRYKNLAINCNHVLDIRHIQTQLSKIRDFSGYKLG